MKNILITVLCILLLGGCKKETDYRDKFIGNYNFTIHRTTSSGLPPNYTTTDTTYNYHGKVEYGSTTNSVLILFSDKSTSIYSAEPMIYEEGSFKGQYGAHGSLAGEFESTKKVKFYTGSASPGSSSQYEITGEKE